MSEQGSESTPGTEPGSADEGEAEGLDGLQESKLDSVTGGGEVRGSTMDLQESRPDTIKKSGSPGQYETEETSGPDPRDD